MIKWILVTFLGLVLASLPAGGPRESEAQTAPDPRFGMTEVFWLPEEAQDLGVGWERILFYWREIQPSGPEDWNTLHVREEWLDEARAQGREIVGLIKNTAPWASTDGTEAGLPKGLYLPEDDPDNLWANYVRRLAAYYGQRNVHHWIIWNEPEIVQDAYGFEFAGSAADYYQLLKTAYKVIKENDPEAVIHLAGLTWWHDPTFLERLLAIAAADPESAENDFFFDVISLHIYFRTETVRSIIEEVTSIQARYGLDKPIWINETNAPPNRDPDWPVDRPRFNIDLEQQAWFIIQAMALGFASGAERVSVYKLLDIHLPPGGESFGVLRPDQSRRPAYDAYKLATRCLSAFDDIVIEEDPAYYRLTFSRPGSLTHVVWARTRAGGVVQIGASTKSATVLRLSESPAELLPEEERYTLQLSGQRCDEECLVGGEPVVLLEASDESSYTDACRQYMLPAVKSGSSDEIEAEIVGQNRSEDNVTESQIESPTAVATATATIAAVGIVASANDGQSIEPAATNPPARATAANDVVDLVEQPGDGDSGSSRVAAEPASGQSETAGLWFLGVGFALALLIAVLYYLGRRSQLL